MLIIHKANETDVKRIVKFVDSTFTKEGYGFVTSAQINTEVKHGAVYIAEVDNEIVGVRIGKNRVYNLAVHKEYRHKGIGRKLIEIEPPDIIRVKAEPVGNLSKEQLKTFKNPEGFYEALGYALDSVDYARNFWQRGKKGERAHFHKQGKKKHIKLYKKLQKPKNEENNNDD